MSEMNTELRPPIDVVVWGDTGAGKTTVMAAFLCGPGRPSWVDGAASAAAIRLLQPCYREICASRLPAGTLVATTLSIFDRGGNELALRDMRGGGAGGVDLGDEDCEALAHAAALVVLMEYPSTSSTTRNLVAARAALAQFPADRPVVLVLTKVEGQLDVARAAAWNAGTRPTNDFAIGTALRELVDRVGRENTFVVSVFGYGDDGRPACMLDEVGRTVPTEIRPFFVSEPFERLRDRLGLRGRA